MERKRVDQLEDECEETLSRIDRLIRDGGSVDRMQTLIRKLTILVLKLEKERSTDVITGMKDASGERLTKIKARRESLVERINSKALLGSKLLPDVSLFSKLGRGREGRADFDSR